MELMNIKNLGFIFAIRQQQNGRNLIHVVDRWQNKPTSNDSITDSITLKLNPTTTYSEAQAIAGFINNLVHHQQWPLIEVQEVR